jgi:hypothetical protein
VHKLLPFPRFVFVVQRALRILVPAAEESIAVLITCRSVLWAFHATASLEAVPFTKV